MVHVIGPILFILYVVEVFDSIALYGVGCHSYADDTQVYIMDYCNALLAGIADTQVKRLQSVQNAAVRLVSRARRRDHITPVLCLSLIHI